MVGVRKGGRAVATRAAGIPAKVGNLGGFGYWAVEREAGVASIFLGGAGVGDQVKALRANIIAMNDRCEVHADIRIADVDL